MVIVAFLVLCGTRVKLSSLVYFYFGGCFVLFSVAVLGSRVQAAVLIFEKQFFGGGSRSAQ